MPSIKKLLQAAAGNAGGTLGYVEDVFSTYLYDGNAGTQTITNGIDLDGEGGLVWSRWRSGQYTSRDHNLFDTERGTTGYLNTNNTAAEKTSYTNAITYNSDGFTWNQQFPSNTNFDGEKFASWTFRKAEKFFDVVTYTGNGVAGRTVAHNLGSVPGVIIVKNLSTGSTDWSTYHRTQGATKYAKLNDSGPFSGAFTGQWNETEPTDSVFTVGNSLFVNQNGDTYVAYLFASDAGGFGDDGSESIIKCGSYTGNGSTNGPEIDLGFEPQWLMVKNSTASSDWYLVDTMRGFTANTEDSYQRLMANLSNAEDGSNAFSINSTGFKLVNATYNPNVSGNSYIYIAIRRPMKTPESGTEVFNGVLTNSDNSTGTGFPVDIGFPVDLAWVKYTTLGAGALWMHRLTGLTSNPQPGKGKLSPANTTAEANSGELWGGDNNTGYRIYGHNYQRICYGFKRATGFFDMVAYTGTGVARTVTHNLGVVPELMIVKRRSTARNWLVYTAPTGNTKGLFLNLDVGTNTFTGYWNDTTPTASVFTLGNGFDTNSSGDTYIAYLFATLAGVSKVGSYTGTGSNLNVDCGFAAGARFILIKRTDSTGDWYYWDTIRGIVAGNDPYVLLNTTAVQVTGTDYIDPLSSGFTVTSSAPAALNASGGTYIFLAIA